MYLLGLSQASGTFDLGLILEVVALLPATESSLTLLTITRMPASTPSMSLLRTPPESWETAHLERLGPEVARSSKQTYEYSSSLQRNSRKSRRRNLTALRSVHRLSIRSSAHSIPELDK
jgi:hypothetical protein